MWLGSGLVICLLVAAPEISSKSDDTNWLPTPAQRTVFEASSELEKWLLIKEETSETRIDWATRNFDNPAEKTRAGHILALKKITEKLSFLANIAPNDSLRLSIYPDSPEWYKEVLENARDLNLLVLTWKKPSYKKDHWDEEEYLYEIASSLYVTLLMVN